MSGTGVNGRFIASDKAENHTKVNETKIARARRKKGGKKKGAVTLLVFILANLSKTWLMEEAYLAGTSVKNAARYTVQF